MSAKAGAAVRALPVLIGFLLDALIGDPYWMPHPIRLIGDLIAGLERFARKHAKNLRLAGLGIVLTVLLLTGITAGGLLWISYRIHPVLGIAAESILCCYMLAGRCLRDESDKVRKAAAQGDTEGARKAVSMIVGRDTASLDLAGILRAAVETVAENTSDGVTAPLFYMALGGGLGAALYKAANTMDSMLGYKSEKYREIGFFAAKLDDVLNFLPSRLTALLMIAAAFLLRYDGRGAWRIWRRDRNKHESPNSAQTEAACAGALDLQLAGDAYYFGQLHRKPHIGDPNREITPEDVQRANRLMYCTAVFMLVISIVTRTF